MDAGDELASSETMFESVASAPTLGASVTADDAAPRETSPLTGSTLGRYVIVGELGAGGMGAVYAAYDPMLERKVAVKVLHRWGDSDQEHQRLQREAQAMARLSHPNVITVHEFGTHDGRFFVAMEFVDGRTLKVWLSARAREVGEVLTVFRAAGRGLAAAHAEGMVHRDFKPDNVMVDETGRVRVMDFGLARASDQTTGSDAQLQTTELHLDGGAASRSGTGGGSSGGVARSLTRTGAIVGTPAYMSPEQHSGLTVDARSDQFSFCVALWEALFKARPFEGKTLTALVLSIHEGKIREPPPGHGVPAALVSAVRRGLDPDPARRWPSMDALLEALEHDPSRRARTVLAVGVAVTLAAGVGAVVGAGLGQPEVATGPTCDDAAAEMQTLWNDERSAAVRQAFTATELGYAGVAADRVDAALRGRVEALASVYVDACQRHLDGAQSDELYDLRVACLERQRQRTVALVEVLANADSTVVENAGEAVASLPSPSRCADAEALRRPVPLPEGEAERDAVARVEERLAQVQALSAAGRYADALSTLDESKLLASARATGYAPTWAAVALEKGEILRQSRGDVDEASAVLREAYHQAVRGHDDVLAARAASAVTYVEGEGAMRKASAAAWMAVAQAQAARVESFEAEVAAARARAYLGMTRGDYPAAQSGFEEVLALQLEHLPADHPDIAGTYSNLALAQGNATGNWSVSAELLGQALPIQEATLGAQHPAVATTLNMMAANLDLKDAERSIELMKRAVAISEGTLGPDHNRTITRRSNMASYLAELGRYEEAIDTARAAHESMLETAGRSAPLTAVTANQLGWVTWMSGDAEQAVAPFEIAVELRRQHLGEDAYMTGISECNLGGVWLDQGEVRRAAPLIEHCMVALKNGVDEDNPRLAYAEIQLGRLALRRGRAAAAVEIFERALARRVAAEAGPKYLAEAHLGLAAAVVGSDKVAATEHLDRAAEQLDACTPACAAQRRQLEHLRATTLASR